MRKERKYGVDVIVNKSYRYILPMLGDDIGDFVNLTGCFIKDDKYPEWDNNIFLLFRSDSRQHFLDFEKRLTYHPYYIKWFEADIDHHMFVFNVPYEHQTNYDLFKLSRYSELSKPYKEHIIKFHHYNKYGIGKNTIRVLYRDPTLYDQKEEEINKGIPEKDWTLIPRDQEIGEKLHEDEEIYNYKIKENI